MIAELRPGRTELARCLGCLMRACSHSRHPEPNPVLSSRSACDGLRCAILVIEPSVLARKLLRACLDEGSWHGIDYKDCDAGEAAAIGCVRMRFFPLVEIETFSHVELTTHCKDVLLLCSACGWFSNKLVFSCVLRRCSTFFFRSRHSTF